MIIGLDRDRRRKGVDELMFIDTQFDAAQRLWVEKLRAALASDTETMLRSCHMVSFLCNWQEFEGDADPREWVASAVSQPRLLPKLLAAFVHEGHAHTFGDHVTHNVVSFRLEPLLSFIDLPAVLKLTRALPRDMGRGERAACDRFIEAAENHLAKITPIQNSSEAVDPDALQAE
jgi:hypothetical protein